MANSDPNWTSLIPPMPKKVDTSSSNVPAKVEHNHSVDNLKVFQRHSIAISPNSSEIGQDDTSDQLDFHSSFDQTYNQLNSELIECPNSPDQKIQLNMNQTRQIDQTQSKELHYNGPQYPNPVHVKPPLQSRHSQQVTYHTHDVANPFQKTPPLQGVSKLSAPSGFPPQVPNRGVQVKSESQYHQKPHMQPSMANNPNPQMQPSRIQRHPSLRRPSVPPPMQPPHTQGQNLTSSKPGQKVIMTKEMGNENQPKPQSRYNQTNFQAPQGVPNQFLQQKTLVQPSKSVKKNRKICSKCKLEITGQFVRALQNPYHVECFTCNECGRQCADKFFPYELKDPEKGTDLVALCEYDYFKKLDLICFNCNTALRGPYITALGNKYHLEHFKCAVCQKVFESDESYYEHESSIYCHYHYSKLFASKCEGCQSSIVKQFVELFRGGRNQQWHPECYMVHKFWNVCILADSVGLSKQLNIPTQNVMGIINDTNDASLLHSIENQIENTVMNCWLTLSGYEETTASCISDMLLNAFVGNQPNGLFVTGKLILNVEILFTALDNVLDMTTSSVVTEKLMGMTRTRDIDDSIDSTSDAYFQLLKKEPRNISGKIMSYLAVLRKSSQINTSGSLSGELLSVITGCAHYLKLLIRLGLNNALKLNQLLGNTDATDVFLSQTRQYENYVAEKEPNNDGTYNDKISASILARLTIPPNSTDACTTCNKSIEKACVKFVDNKRWHLKCFCCSSCGRMIETDEIQLAKYDSVGNFVLCKNCYNEDSRPGFELISDLKQLVYLLHIALSRSSSAMKVNLRDHAMNHNDTRQESRRQSEVQNLVSSNLASVDGYSKTIEDVTNLRTRRQSQKLSNSIKKNARKSIILDAPEAVRARQDTTKDSEESLKTSINRQSSSSSYLSYNPLTPETDQFNLKNGLKIQDEPSKQTLYVNLDRTTDLLKNEKSLTLDDIPRIVAAEQAREQRPNAFKHHNSLYQRQKPIKPVRYISTTQKSPNAHATNTTEDVNANAPSKEELEQTPKNQKYYSELTKNEHFIIRHIALEAFVQLNGTKYNKDELLCLIETRKSPTFWDKFKFGAGKTEKHSAVFGVDLNELTKKYGMDSDLGVGPSSLRIPIFVDDVINALKRMDMSVEGIFRLNGNIKKLRELTEQINKHPTKSPDFTVQSAVQLAALMKKWLRELPNPLLTYNLYELWICSQHHKDPLMRKRIIQLCYCMLPRSHRNLVEVLLYFFSWVASFAEIDEETGSKMDIHNLATVIAPNVLIPKSAATDGNGNGNSTTTGNIQQSGEGFFYAIEVLNQMIEQHEELSIIPDDVLQLYERCNFTKDNLTTKEINQKIEKVLQDDPDYFRNFKVQPMEELMENKEVRSNTITRNQTKFTDESHGETTNI
jgi:hypothetical protein